MQVKALLRFQDWPISTKIVAFTLTLAIGSLVTMGYIQSKSLTQSILERQVASLEAVNVERASRIEGMFRFVEGQVGSIAADHAVVTAMEDFTAGFDELNPELTGLESGWEKGMANYYSNEFIPRLVESDLKSRGVQTYMPGSLQGKVAQTLYIANNPAPVGSKLDFDRAPQDIAFNTAHEAHHAFFIRYLQVLGAYDIFLVNPEGDIIYSVFKETDYATNLLNGPYADTGLAEAFKASLRHNEGEVATTDFAFYEPSYGASAIFFGAPIRKDGKLIGSICAQLPLQDLFDEILASPIGESGESRLLGDDQNIRSVLPGRDELMLSTKIESESAEHATKHEVGSNIGQNEADVKELAVYTPLDLEGLGWSLYSTIDFSEVVEPAVAMRKTLLFQTLISAGIIIAFSIFFAKSFSKPIRLIVSHLERIASGDFTKKLELNRRDELGQLSISVDQMTDQISEMIREVSNCAHEVAGASTQIAATAEQLSMGLNRQEAQTNDVSAAIEEMSSSIAGIAEQSTTAAKTSNDAGQQAEQGGAAVSSTIEEIGRIEKQVNEAVSAVKLLGERSEEIGEIIAVINDIADQTNLLALNAAIEAARAGEQGRGFAVVADEVRKLAERTQQATEQVSTSIREIQHDTSSAINEIEKGSESVKLGVDKATDTGKSLSEIVESSRSIKQMVEGISESIAEQNSATESIAQATTEIASVTREASSAGTQAAEAATNLSAQSEKLRTMTSEFKV